MPIIQLSTVSLYQSVPVQTLILFILDFMKWKYLILSVHTLS